MSGYLKAGVFLFVANIGFGICNYLVLLLTVKRLDLESLGAFSTELAYFNIVIALGMVLKYQAILSPVEAARDRVGKILSTGIGFLSIIFGALCLTGKLHPDPALILAAAVPSAVAYQYWTGRLQAREAFVLYGVISLSLGVFRLGFSVLSYSPAGFSLAVLGSSSIMLAAVVTASWRGDDATHRLPGPARSHLGFPVLVAFAFCVLPQIDLLNVRYFLGVRQAGHFSHLQIFSKILFFAPFSLLQITLPRYIKALGKPDADSISTLHRIEALGILSCYAAVAIFAVAGSQFSRSVLGIPENKPLEILLVSAATVPLYGLLNAIQVHAAARDYRRCLLLVGMIGLSPLLASIIPWQSLTAYLFFALALNTAGGAIGTLLTRRLMRPKATRPRVLVLCVSGIGNTILQTPLVHALLRSGAYEVDILFGNEAMAEIYAGESRVLNRYRLATGSRSILKLIRTLRRNRYDFTVSCCPSNRMEFHLFPYLIGARTRIVHRYPTCRLRTLSFLSNRKLDADITLHDVEQNLQLLRALDLDPAHESKQPVFRLTHENRRFGEEFMRGITGRITVGIHPSRSAQPEKCWPEERFREVIERVKTDAQVILFGSSEELAPFKDLSGVRLCRSNLGNVAAVIALCDLFFSCDSGLAHVAASQGVRQLVIAGPGLPRTRVRSDRATWLGETDLPFYRYPFFSNRPTFARGAERVCERVASGDVIGFVRETFSKGADQ